ncbi:DeoR/GlpR family DNA-binding transcription regulator [Thalassospira mesophila]|uniref:DeoR family transcriptional regulator n=1 Tax=Thalassospira mesophila TaxID=1293891 RepID=A0A1Y2KWK5_9PROT|nr:DeoR/GlpR family DNA-binding transcription regulator [Thalassospira mesophila]OSQ36389.1 DeoR family transcriptional regulator [Thalassospira mesophila]
MKGDRLSDIRQYLYNHGFSHIQAIADSVGASLATVRRDLLALEAQGAIVRTHGGARIADAIGIEIGFEQRERSNLVAKRAIADAAYDLLIPKSSVFLDAGTTVLQIARRLRLDPMPLSVFTNCVTVAQVLMDVRDIRITLIGGQLRPENASMVGPIAESALERLWFDQLFLGAGAIAEDGCIYSLDDHEARANELMIARSSKTALLVDSSKFGHRLTYRVGPLSNDLHVITDEAISDDWRTRLKDIGAPISEVAIRDAK